MKRLVTRAAFGIARMNALNSSASIVSLMK